jgi:uncharacterized protein (DUF1697 family)
MVSALALLARLEGGEDRVTTYVGLLYSIVIDAKRRVVMSDLRSIAEGLGHRNVRTLVSSGNLVFESDQTSISGIETDLEHAFAAFHGKHVDIIVKTAADWLKLVRSNPFRAEGDAAPDQVGVRVMRDPADENLLGFSKPYQTAGERVAIVDGHVWVHYRSQASLSKLAGQMTPKRMGGVGTARNWNTVRRLGEMVAE